MITIKYLEATINCTTAIKGADYIHLLDDEGTLVASFDGVSDFSKFSITGGSWTDPAPLPSYKVAVFKEDGTLCGCGVALGDFHKKGDTTVLAEGIQYGTELPDEATEGQVFFVIQ
jgi:hypothetical protein